MASLVNGFLDSVAVKTMRLVSKQWRSLVDVNIATLKPRTISEQLMVSLE